MSAELAKLRYLHLPRWTAAAVLAGAVAVGLGLLLFRRRTRTATHGSRRWR